MIEPIARYSMELRNLRPVCVSHRTTYSLFKWLVETREEHLQLQLSSRLTRMIV